MKISSLVFTLLIFIAGYSQSYAETPIKAQDPAYIEVSKTAGFLVGQHYSVERIKTEFPDLAQSAQVADMEFNAAFGKAEKAITTELQTMLKHKYAEYENGLKGQIRDNLSKQALTHEDAANFIAELSDRARGTMPSPMLETLLTYQYKENPSEEFSRKFIHSYSTKGNAKAKGLELTFSYPASWKPAEADRPNIAQKFISENGHGLETFLIMIKDLPLPAGYVVTPQELDELYTESELKGMIPEGSNFISAKPVVLDNHKGGVILFDQKVQRLDITKTLRAQMYVTVIKDKMVFLQFMVTDREDGTLQSRFDKFEPLFKMVANSFVIQNQYGDAGEVSTTAVKPVSYTAPTTTRSTSSVFSSGNLILSLVITWVIGLTPPALIRFLLWRKPIKKWPAIGIVTGFWLLNFVIFVGLMGSQSKSHFALLLIAYVSYRILKSGEPAPAIASNSDDTPKT